MDLRDFTQFHLPALEADELRFNLQIAVITAAVEHALSDFSHWTLGAPGHCAIKSPGRAILLGNLDRSECHELAQTVLGLEYPGVVGADETARWFAERATGMGAEFEDPIPQRIHVLSSPPHYPMAHGSPRAVGIADAPLLFEWLSAFHREAVPHDPPPELANVEKLVAGGRFLFLDEQGSPGLRRCHFPSSTPISAIPCRIAAMPKLVSSLTATPGTI